MILASTTETVEFRPPWRADAGAPVFRLRAASVIERGMMEAELAGEHQAGRVFPYELTGAIRDGVETLLAGDPAQAELLTLLDAEGQGEAVALGDEQKLLLAEVRKVLAASWPAYRDLVAQIARRKEVAPIVALRRFCVGIEGEGVVFKRDAAGQVSEATLAQLDWLEIVAAGNRAYALAYPSAADEGNFERPGSSAKDPTTSGTEDNSTAAGSSTGDTGKKTRGSPSRRGRSPRSTSSSSRGATRGR